MGWGALILGARGHDHLPYFFIFSIDEKQRPVEIVNLKVVYLDQPI
jgi:hypothetical protein